MSMNSPSNETLIPTLILFVSGEAPRSKRARHNLAAALKSESRESIAPLEIDVLTQPERTFTYSVFATPALLKINDDEKVSLLYGDLSNEKALIDFISDL